MYRYFYRFRLLPCHLFFPIFHFFCIVGGIGCRGVFFLWFFGVGSVDGFRPAFRSASRLAFPVSFLVPSIVPLLDPFCPFRSSPRSSVCPAFRLFVWAYRRGGSFGTGRCLGAGRLACRLAWRDVGAFVVCAVFVSSCSWALAVVSGFPFSPFGVSSVLLVSAGREVRCLSCECRSGRMRLRCGVVSFSRPVLASRLCLLDWRPVPSRLLLVVVVALFGLVSSGVSCGGVFSVVWALAVWRCVVAECGRCGVAMGVAMFVVWRRGGVACRGACRGRFGDAVSCGGACGAGRGAGRMARRGRSE